MSSTRTLVEVIGIKNTSEEKECFDASAAAWTGSSMLSAAGRNDWGALNSMCRLAVPFCELVVIDGLGDCTLDASMTACKMAEIPWPFGSTFMEMRQQLLKVIRQHQWAIHEAYPGNEGRDIMQCLVEDLGRDRAWLNNGVFIIISQA
jgi:hypothetical protein